MAIDGVLFDFYLFFVRSFCVFCKVSVGFRLLNGLMLNLKYTKFEERILNVLEGEGKYACCQRSCEDLTRCC